MKYTKILWIFLIGFFSGILMSRLCINYKPSELGSSLVTNTVTCEVLDNKIYDCKINADYTLDDVVNDWYTIYIENTK